jgi:hypothetical protein
MRAAIDDANEWARNEFSNLEVGDRRRRCRLIKMAAVAARSPSGMVARTYASASDRQGAYDLLESKKVTSEALLSSMSIACVDRCAGADRVLVPLDGSSLTLVDRRYAKNFGAIGSYKTGARGLKVVSAVAISADGTPAGVCAQRWWTRPVVRRKRGGSKYRPTDERESRHWVDTIADVHAAFAGSGTSPMCIIDREGDATEMLHAFQSRQMDFIVRSSWDRRLVSPCGSRLRKAIARAKCLGGYKVDVAAGPNRNARVARMKISVTRVTLDLHHDWRGKRPNITVFAVCAKELSPPPKEKALEWILLTNQSAASLEAAIEIVRCYTFRWRIEEFHKAWKSGACNVEKMQLRTAEAASTWATLLAAVAIRVERLKHLARTEPELPASIELSPAEIEATIIMKRRQKKRTETIPDSMPTIAQVVLWIAELGSYAGKSSGGPPGAITIARGLEKVRAVASAIEQLRAEGKMR